MRLDLHRSLIWIGLSLNSLLRVFVGGFFPSLHGRSLNEQPSCFQLNKIKPRKQNEGTETRRVWGKLFYYNAAYIQIQSVDSSPRWVHALYLQFQKNIK